jgi:hypothetical protein
VLHACAIYRSGVDRCEGCGFEYDLTRAQHAGSAIVGRSDALAVLLKGLEAQKVRTRPSPEVWSPLEYGCHVRDVLLVQRERVLAARRVERPSFDPMGRDERVEHDGYISQDAAAVARQLGDAARLLANVFDRLGPEDWERTVMYNYPKHLERTLRWVAVHTEHEARHHLRDVQDQLS